MKLKRRYNCKPDLPDFRDFKFKDRVPKVAVLPVMMSLQAQQCQVVDQGQEGSCTANAGAGAMGFLELKTKPAHFEPYSRQFLYYNERRMEGDVGQDNGAQLRDCMKALYTWGVPYEPVWPYSTSMFLRAPASVYAEAASHKITWFVRLESIDDMKQCIAGGNVFVYGFTVYESFESDIVASTGIVPMPNPSEDIVGGHAVLGVGYDDSTQTILTKNSWGTWWGQQGYFQMPYDYFTPDLVSDIWCIKR